MKRSPARRRPPKRPPRLTPRQARALALFRDFWAAHGRGPTARELGDQLGVKEGAARLHMQALHHAGALRRIGAPGSWCAFAPVEP